jgi:hypothetical protein
MKTHGISRRVPSFLALHMAFACYTLGKLKSHPFGNSPYSFDQAILLFGGGYLLESALIKRLVHLASMHTFGKALNLIDLAILLFY